MYGLEETYQITPNTEANTFLEQKVQEHFGYVPKSKREKFLDIPIDDKTYMNVKTINLNSGTVGGGRICTVEINQWLRNPENNLKLFYIEYTNDNGHIIIHKQYEHFIEEVEYVFLNQGKGCLNAKTAPKGSPTVVVTRPKISREEWIGEFQYRYREWVEKQKALFDKHVEEFCSDPYEYKPQNDLTEFM